LKPLPLKPSKSETKSCKSSIDKFIRSLREMYGLPERP
jgi:hypothetical protein